jgi:hypothetical protein
MPSSRLKRLAGGLRISIANLLRAAPGLCTVAYGNSAEQRCCGTEERR